MVSEVYFFCLIGNVLIYSTAWILLGGPEFKFLSEYPAILYTLRAILLFMYILWPIAYWLGTGAESYFEDDLV